MVYIKLGEHDKTIKTPHKSDFCEHILGYEEEEEDLFHDVSQEVNNSLQSSDWENLSADDFLRWVNCYELFSCSRIIFSNFGAHG